MGTHIYGETPYIYIYTYIYTPDIYINLFTATVLEVLWQLIGQVCEEDLLEPSRLNSMAGESPLLTENHGEKSWENHRKVIGKVWENHGKMMAETPNFQRRFLVFHSWSTHPTASWPCAADQRRLEKCRAENSDLHSVHQNSREIFGVYLYCYNMSGNIYGIIML